MTYHLTVFLSQWTSALTRRKVIEIARVSTDIRLQTIWLLTRS